MLVGAAKCGTTSLFEVLGEHPQIYIPENKEPWFYSHVDEDISQIELGPQKDMIVTDMDKYLALYTKKQTGDICGDASTSYLYDYLKTIDNIKKLRDSWEEIKIVIVIRDPVERAYSHYLNNIRSGSEGRRFSVCIDRCTKGIQTWYKDYLHYGLYYEQILAFREQFKAVKIIIFEDLIVDFESVIYPLFKFLGVDETYRIPELPKENSSGVPTSQYITKIIHQKNLLKTVAKTLVPRGVRKSVASYINNRFMSRPNMTDEQREFLVSYYMEDVSKVRELLGSNLERWKNFSE